MGHYVCHPIIRSLGPSGAHKGPNFIFKMMRLNVWHMHCWHNSWVSLYYLIPKHVCCGSDGEGQIATSCGHQRGKYRRITMLVHIHRYTENLETSHKITLRNAHEQSQPTLHPPLPVSLFQCPWQEDTYIYTHTPAHGVSISSSPVGSHSPVKGDEVRRGWGHI